jgi:colicin import membrane protein
VQDGTTPLQAAEQFGRTSIATLIRNEPKRREEEKARKEEEELKIFREGSVRVKSATALVARAQATAAAAVTELRAKEDAAASATAAAKEIAFAAAAAAAKEIAAAAAAAKEIAAAAVQRYSAVVKEADDAKVCVRCVCVYNIYMHI